MFLIVRVSDGEVINVDYGYGSAESAKETASKIDMDVVTPADHLK